MGKYKCPICNNTFEGELDFCPHCGSKLSFPRKSFTMKCPICGGTHIIKCEYFMGANDTCFTCLPVGFPPVTTTRYVCEECGYLLEFFSQDDVKKIKEKFGK